ncbi:DUF7713 domain-containing protein [Sutcliffiella deserti]
MTCYRKIEHDEHVEEVPLTIIDGKPHIWDEFFKMLMTNEGFNSKWKSRI